MSNFTRSSLSENAPHRFQAAAILDPTHAGRDADRIAEAIISHLADQHSVKVRMTLEVEAELPPGASEMWFASRPRKAAR